MTQDEIIEMWNSVIKYARGEVRITEFAKLVAAKALVQPEQEPVCPECKAGVLYECVSCSSNNYPPQRTWVGLTDDEMENTFIQCGGKWNGDYWEIEDADFHPFLRTIEAKLKDKNCVG